MSDLRLPKRLKGQHPSVHRSRKQERSTAKRVGGNVTKASGAGDFEKGDVRVKRVSRIECKTTKAKSFSVTLDMIEKIEAAALQAGEVPVMEIEIDNTARKPVSVIVMPSWALDMLLQRGAE